MLLKHNNKLTAIIDDEQVEFDLPTNQVKFLYNLQCEAMGRAHVNLKPSEIADFTKAMRIIADSIDKIYGVEANICVYAT